LSLSLIIYAMLSDVNTHYLYLYITLIHRPTQTMQTSMYRVKARYEFYSQQRTADYSIHGPWTGCPARCHFGHRRSRAVYTVAGHSTL